MNLKVIKLDIHQHYITIKYKFMYNFWLTWKHRILTALSFLKLSWKALWGKICIMDTELMESNAGYKYKALIISKLPVSIKHTYENL